MPGQTSRAALPCETTTIAVAASRDRLQPISGFDDVCDLDAQALHDRVVSAAHMEAFVALPEDPERPAIVRTDKISRFSADCWSISSPISVV